MLAKVTCFGDVVALTKEDKRDCQLGETGSTPILCNASKLAQFHL